MNNLDGKSSDVRDLTGHYALITGATGGVGQACAEVFAKQKRTTEVVHVDCVVLTCSCPLVTDLRILSLPGGSLT